MKSEILQVVESTVTTFALFIEYEEGDIASAIGNVYAVSGDRDSDAAPVQLLATNDTLRLLWLSPQGSLWVASADGNVGTTASVKWPAPGRGFNYVTQGNSPAWTATALPLTHNDGLPPNITALWGTGDDDVFAGTYGGHIYHWNGQQWSQTYQGPGDGNRTITAIGGPHSNDVFALGEQGALLHFNGKTWRSLPLPGAPNGNEGFTGVHPLADGTVVISAAGDEGRLLHGTASALTELGRYPIELIGMAALGDRLLFATGDGVAELIGRDVKMIKSSFETTTVSAGLDKLFFIEPAQEFAGYVEYKPAETEAPWWGFEFDV
jgi:hypothetical protein